MEPKVVIPRNCMLWQGACWVGIRTPAREQLLEPGRRGGVGEGYYMYILYTENCNPVSTRPEARGLGGFAFVAEDPLFFGELRENQVCQPRKNST